MIRWMVVALLLVYGVADAGMSVPRRGVVAGGSGPTTAFTDNFNRANQNPLVDGKDTSSTPTGTWGTPSGVGSIYIYDSKLGAGGSDGRGYATEVLGNDQWASTTVPTDGSGGAGVRLASGANTGYYLIVYPTSTRVKKILAGTESELYNYTITNTGQVFKLSITGTTLTLYVDGVAQSPTTTDSDISSGYAGVNLPAYGAADNFECGEN